jgi:hypothetical protein
VILDQRGSVQHAAGDRFIIELRVGGSTVERQGVDIDKFWLATGR